MMLFKVSKLLLISSSILWVIISVFTVTFCIIRFVLPIELPKNSEHLLIFIIPSSIIQAAISAAGLCASLSALFWPIFCYALVLTIPFSVSLSWIHSLLTNYSATYEREYYVIVSILIVANVSWLCQIVCSLYLSWQLRGGNKQPGLIGQHYLQPLPATQYSVPRPVVIGPGYGPGSRGPTPSRSMSVQQFQLQPQQYQPGLNVLLDCGCRSTTSLPPLSAGQPQYRQPVHLQPSSTVSTFMGQSGQNGYETAPPVQTTQRISYLL